MDEIKAYLGEKKLPQYVQTRAILNYSYFLKRKSSFQENVVLDGLPDEMVITLVHELYCREISSISLFREATSYSEKCFIVHLVRNLRPQRAARGEVIFNAGDIATNIVFVMSGFQTSRTSSCCILRDSYEGPDSHIQKLDLGETLSLDRLAIHSDDFVPNFYHSALFGS